MQGHVGAAFAYHGNDRNRDGFELGQRELEKALNLCIEVSGQDDPVDPTRGPWGESPKK